MNQQRNLPHRVLPNLPPRRALPRYAKKRHDEHKKVSAMTVCLAAICQHEDGEGMLIVAADRMLTAGDLVRFEPQRSKIIELSDHAVILIAGDTNLHAEILMDLRPEITSDMNIKEIAIKYQDHYNSILQARSANAVLAPYGLDHKSFIEKQGDMAPEFRDPIIHALFSYEMPPIQAIFAGVDSVGPQIYVLNQSELTCRNMVGFAAIGAGQWHAESQFMFSGHTGKKPWGETLWLLYTAKKRAEVAPGVGEHTDIRIFGEGFKPSLLPDSEVAKLQDFYETLKAEEDSANQGAVKRVQRMIEED